MIELHYAAHALLADPAPLTVRPNPDTPCEYHVYLGDERISSGSSRKLAEALMWELKQWRQDCWSGSDHLHGGEPS